jgi:hypothetical protein
MEILIAIAAVLFGWLAVTQFKMLAELQHRINDLELKSIDNRARDASGKFVADDPATPVNEAYKKQPAKKPAKKAAKKPKK